MISILKVQLGLTLTRCTCIVGLTAAGCAQTADSPVVVDARPTIAIEADTVAVQTANEQLTGTIVATYTNRTNQPVYLGTCGTPNRPGFTMDKEVEGDWVSSYEPVCPFTPGPPLEVLPGESRTDTLEVRDYLHPGHLRSFHIPEIPGAYRLAYQVYDCCRTPPGGAVQHGSRLPREEHVSEAFQIDLVD